MQKTSQVNIGKLTLCKISRNLSSQRVRERVAVAMLNLGSETIKLCLKNMSLSMILLEGW